MDEEKVGRKWLGLKSQKVRMIQEGSEEDGTTRGNNGEDRNI